MQEAWLDRSWGGVGPASASGSLSPFSPAAVYGRPGALLQKDSLLTAAQLKAKVREAMAMPVMGGHRLWPGRGLSLAWV